MLHDDQTISWLSLSIQILTYWLYAWVEIKTHPGVDQARAWLSETGQTGGTGRIIGSSDWFYLKEQISAKLAVGCLGLNFI